MFDKYDWNQARPPESGSVNKVLVGGDYRYTNTAAHPVLFEAGRQIAFLHAVCVRAAKAESSNLGDLYLINFIIEGVAGEHEAVLPLSKLNQAFGKELCVDSSAQTAKGNGRKLPYLTGHSFECVLSSKNPSAGISKVGLAIGGEHTYPLEQTTHLGQGPFVREEWAKLQQQHADAADWADVYVVHNKTKLILDTGTTFARVLESDSRISDAVTASALIAIKARGQLNYKYTFLAELASVYVEGGATYQEVFGLLDSYK